MYKTFFRRLRDEGEGGGAGHEPTIEPGGAPTTGEKSEVEKLAERVEALERELASARTRLEEYAASHGRHLEEYKHERIKRDAPAGEPGPAESHWYYRSRVS